MKFRADPKDVLIFIAFCVFLLYIVAIGVLNTSSLVSTGQFYGIVPFKAFSSEYLATTLTLFFLLLIGIFVAVSSYFFDREKGFGFSGTKKDKGYSRWAKDKEIKNAKDIYEISPTAYKEEHGGIPVINTGSKMWIDDGEMHNLVVGSTGAGKTSLVVFPQTHSLAKAGESIILTDPKGELYENTAEMLKERGYNIIVLNFRNPQNGNAWNPMYLPYRLYKEGNVDKAIELLEDLALNILYEEKSSADPFWEKTAADYFVGLSLGLFEDGNEDQININSVSLMCSLGEEKYRPNTNYIKEYFNSKDPSKPAYTNASGTVYTAEETKQSILSTFKQKIKLFASRENLSEMLSYSDFDMYDISKKKTAVFLIVQDEKKTLHPLATIFIKQCYETLIDFAQESGGKLPFRTNFILDEFANMPPLKDVTTMVTAARSRRIRFTFIIQNYAQLAQVYGKENGDTIRGNCNILYLISNELAALEEISKMCGEVKSKEKDKTASTPLVTVSDLQHLSYGEGIWLRLRMMPYKTKLKDHYKMSFGKTYAKAEYVKREKREVKTFDIREYVKQLNNKKMEEMFGDASMANAVNPMPFGMPGIPGMPNMLNMGVPNPFMKDENLESSMPSSFDVDELVKKIDAQLAKLEEEERLEQQHNNMANKDDLIIENETNNEKEISNQIENDNFEEDKFFDDFFSDE